MVMLLTQNWVVKSEQLVSRNIRGLNFRHSTVQPNTTITLEGVGDRFNGKAYVTDVFTK
jgi:hypothetical protein